jgi:hypothetical protein
MFQLVFIAKSMQFPLVLKVIGAGIRDLTMKMLQLLLNRGLRDLPVQSINITVVLDV